MAASLAGAAGRVDMVKKKSWARRNEIARDVMREGRAEEIAKFAEFFGRHRKNQQENQNIDSHHCVCCCSPSRSKGALLIGFSLEWEWLKNKETCKNAH